MNCLSDLITSRFLKKTIQEIKQANAALLTNDMQPRSLGILFGRKEDRKKLYDSYMRMCDFKSSFQDIDVTDDDMLYYLQEGPIVLVMARTKSYVDKVVTDSLYTTGDFCFYRGKHYIHNRTHHTAMFDMDFTITPLTTN